MVQDFDTKTSSSGIWVCDYLIHWLDSSLWSGIFVRGHGDLVTVTWSSAWYESLRYPHCQSEATLAVFGAKFGSVFRTGWHQHKKMDATAEDKSQIFATRNKPFINGIEFFFKFDWFDTLPSKYWPFMSKILLSVTKMTLLFWHHIVWGVN